VSRIEAAMLKQTIIEQINHVASEQARLIAPLTDDLILLNSGLDSLCFAIIVARLEQKLGVDPFAETEDLQYPVTLGDLVRCYDKLAA
jgi:acyl carrier protein